MTKTGGFFRDLLRFIILTVVIVVPIRAYVAQPFIVSGVSMVPSFEDGEYLVIDELSYRFRAPVRGEVIVFRYPKDPSKFFIKRVIGLPGETIKIAGGQVVIRKGETEFTLNEPYITDHNLGAAEETLDEGQYFVLGDNRSMSLDSRAWGAVPEDNIKGRVLVRLFPLDRITLFSKSSS